jgi:hypothetical protein
MTTKEIIAIIDHFNNGGVVEWKYFDTEDWREYTKSEHETTNNWKWNDGTYRIKPTRINKFPEDISPKSDDSDMFDNTKEQQAPVSQKGIHKYDKIEVPKHLSDGEYKGIELLENINNTQADILDCLNKIVERLK